MRDHVNSLLQELAHSVAAGPLMLNERNVCSLLVDDELECNIEFDGDQGWLYTFSPLMRPPPTDLIDFLANLLRANLFGLDTDGGHLGLCDRTGLVVYSRRCKTDALDGLAFRQEFDAFVATVQELKATFSSPADSPADEGVGVPPVAESDQPKGIRV